MDEKNKGEMLSYYASLASKLTGGMIGVATTVATGDRFLGPAIGIAIAQTLETVGKDIIARKISPRQEIRVARAYTVAYQKLLLLQDAGKNLRDDDFFVKDSHSYSQADELTEAALMAAMTAAEERKVDFVGALLAYIITYVHIDVETGHLLIEMSQSMTFRGMVLLKIASEKGAHDFPARPREQSSEAASSMFPVMIEAYNLARRGIIEMKDSIDADDAYALLGFDEVDPAKMYPSFVGQLLYEGVSLKDMPSDDKTLLQSSDILRKLSACGIGFAAGGNFIKAVAAEELRAGCLVNFYENDAAQVLARLADSENLVEATGFVRKTAQKGDEVKIFSEGEIRNRVGLKSGERYFLSTRGDFTVVPPEGPNHYSQIVGFAASSSTLVVQIKDPILLS